MPDANPISLKHRIIGISNGLKNKVMWFNLYRKTYSNFLHVLLSDFRNNYPIKAIFKDKTSKNFHSRDESAMYALLSTHKDVTYDEKNDLAIINIEQLHLDFKKIKLYGIKQNLDSIPVFYDKTYKNLQLKNKTVIDVGACTGDTSIFFAINGAKKVVAIEPYPKNFEILKKNIEANNLTNIITYKLAGCSSKSSYITIDPSFNSSMRSHLQEFNSGIRVPLVTLDQIVQTESISDGVLKLDCEGCEYDVILNSSKEVLKNFSHVQIEYHNGYENIKQKLESCGFIVNILKIENSKLGHLLAYQS